MPREKEAPSSEGRAQGRRPAGLRSASAFLAASGLAMVALSLFPAPVPHVAVLGITGLLATLGLLKGKRWGFLLTLFVLVLYGFFGLSLLRALLVFFDLAFDPLAIALLSVVGLFLASTVAFWLYVFSKKNLFA